MGAKKLVTVAASERLDAANVEAFKAKAQAAIEDSDALIIDFALTTFIDSVGLGSLVGLLKSCSQRRIPLAVACLTPQVRQIFELTHLYRLFDIFDTAEQANAAVRLTAL